MGELVAVFEVLMFQGFKVVLAVIENSTCQAIAKDPIAL